MMTRILVVVVGLTATLSLQSTLTDAWVIPSSPLSLSETQFAFRSTSETAAAAATTKTTDEFFIRYPNNINQRRHRPCYHRVSPIIGTQQHHRKSRLTLSAVQVADGDSSTSTSSTQEQEQLQLQHLQAVVSTEQHDENDLDNNNKSVFSNNKLNNILGPTNNNGDSSELSTQQKVINALFLSAAFGYAIYTILNIDAGLTRGWSASEIAMRIPLDNWGAYESYLANKPIVTKTLINVIIYLLGDWLSQTVFQQKNVLDFDISRTLRNGFIGLCFGPCVHQYYEFSDAILPPENGLVTRLEKIVMDQTIYLTIKCSIYICAVGLLAGEDFATVKQRVKDKIVGIVFTAWKFWPLVHCITYSLIPAQHRILWVNSVDLVWNAILATLAQKKDSVFEELEGEDEVENANLSAFGTPTPIPSSTGAGVGSSFVTLKTFMLVNDTLSAADVDVAIPSSSFQDDDNNNIVSQTNSTQVEVMAL